MGSASGQGESACCAQPELARVVLRRNCAATRCTPVVPCVGIGRLRYFGYHRTKMPGRNSHAEVRIIAEGLHQNGWGCRGCRLWARRGCQCPRLQASGSEEADTGRRSVSRPAEGKPKLRQLSVFLLAQQLRCGRRRDQRIRLVPHVHDVPSARPRRARVESDFLEPCGFAGWVSSASRRNQQPGISRRNLHVRRAAPPHATRGGRALTHPHCAPAHTEDARYGARGSMWTILLVCWPSDHMLERVLGSELFCTSIWRVLMEVGRR
jgi:hypothetical protein